MKYLMTAFVAMILAAPAFAQGTHPFQISEATWRMCQEEGIAVYEECVLAKASVSYSRLQADNERLQTENYDLQADNEQLRGQVEDLRESNQGLQNAVASMETQQDRMQAQLDQILAERSAPPPAPTHSAPPAYTPSPSAYAAPVVTQPVMADPRDMAWTSKPANGEFLAMTGMSWESCEDMGLCTAIYNDSAYSVSIDIGGVRTIVSRAHGATTVNPAPTTFGAETLVGPDQRVYVYVGSTTFDVTYTAYLPIQGTFVPTFVKNITNVRTKGANPFKGVGRMGWSSL